MKQFIISLLLVVITASCYGQQSDSSTSLSVDAYRNKAKGQRVTAAVLGVTGVVLVLGTTIYALDHLFEDNSNLEAPLIVGCVCIVGSIPFITASDRNLKKAKKLSTSFILQPTPPLIAAIKSTTFYPSISLKINL